MFKASFSTVFRKSLRACTSIIVAAVMAGSLAGSAVAQSTTDKPAAAGPAQTRDFSSPESQQLIDAPAVAAREKMGALPAALKALPGKMAAPRQNAAKALRELAANPDAEHDAIARSALADYATTGLEASAGVVQASTQAHEGFVSILALVDAEIVRREQRDTARTAKAAAHTDLHAALDKQARTVLAKFKELRLDTLTPEELEKRLTPELRSDLVRLRTLMAEQAFLAKIAQAGGSSAEGLRELRNHLKRGRDACEQVRFVAESAQRQWEAIATAQKDALEDVILGSSLLAAGNDTSQLLNLGREFESGGSLEIPADFAVVLPAGGTGADWSSPTAGDAKDILAWLKSLESQPSDQKMVEKPTANP